MPTLWYVKDGPVLNGTHGQGIQVSFLELCEVFGDLRLKFLSKNTPQFNVEEPSFYPRRVVIEVEEEDGTDDRFSQSGFYLFLDLSPEETHQLLEEHRRKK
jgi:hypothetical protein